MNLTRKYIEQLNDIEPYCFENDREEQWFNVGLKYGLDVADSNPKSPWISVDDKLPPVEEDGLSVKVFVISTKGEMYFSRYNYDMEVWMSYESDVTFTYWMPIPELPKK